MPETIKSPQIPPDVREVLVNALNTLTILLSSSWLVEELAKGGDKIDFKDLAMALGVYYPCQ